MTFHQREKLRNCAIGGKKALQFIEIGFDKIDVHFIVESDNVQINKLTIFYTNKLYWDNFIKIFKLGFTLY